MKKRVWVITGACNDRTANIVRMARAAGDAVMATGRDVSKLETLFGEDTADFHVFQMDVTSEAQTSLAARTAYFRFGKIDVLVNGEVIRFANKPKEYSESDMARFHQVNVAGGLNILHAVLPYMESRGAMMSGLADTLLEACKARHREIEFITDYEQIVEMLTIEAQELRYNR
jgi:NADP-dependent 3-hydroxy acid dehydrogenase YdfG